MISSYSQASNTVYVGNLSWETDSKSLGDFFSDAGFSVESAEVQYYGNGTRSKGWGLVTFSDSSEVDSAIEKFNDAEMDSRKLIVRADRGATQAPSKVDMDSKDDGGDAGPTLDVFVGNLSWDTTDKTLSQEFSNVGKISNVEVKCRADGRSKGWAVVTFASIDAAQEAVDSLDGKEIDGRAIRVEFQRGPGKSRGRRRAKKKPARGDAAPSKNIFVGNLPWDVNDDELKDMFSGLSPISAEIKQGFDGRSRGYGIVSFGSIEQAQKAISAVNGQDVGGRAVIARFDRD
eukprot:g3929.t1